MRYLFGPGCISGVHQQRHRTDADHPHAGHAAGNTKGPHHLRLLDAQRDERCKLEHQAGAIQDQIDGDEPLVGESERQCPAEAAQQNGYRRASAEGIMRSSAITTGSRV